MRVRAILPLSLLWLPLVAWTAPATSTTVPATAPVAGLTLKQRAQFEALRAAALGPDIAASKRAIREIHSWGIPARRALLDLLRQILARDKTAIEQAAANAKDPAKLRLIEEQVDQVRKEALENIGRLEKGGPVAQAHEHFNRLLDLVGQLNQTYHHRAAAADAVVRRADFLPIFRSIAPATDVGFNPLSEQRLQTLAEKALGMTIAAAMAIPGPEDERGPADGPARRIWFYRLCRLVEAYNSELARGICDPEELENLKLLNQYRECLGLLPMELDARLVQSARRHSREMVELKFFAHESPTAANRTHVLRMKNAGYSAGYGENIAFGPTSGEKVFWMWFDSPGHHKNMVSGCSAIGIGRWTNHWTQNLGRGKRLMLLSAEQRALIKVEGAVLGPDRPPMRRPR